MTWCLSLLCTDRGGRHGFQKVLLYFYTLECISEPELLHFYLSKVVDFTSYTYFEVSVLLFE